VAFWSVTRPINKPLSMIKRSAATFRASSKIMLLYGIFISSLGLRPITWQFMQWSMTRACLSMQ
jgi:hypothetical protein